jgi:hypothetical protein
MKMQSKKVTVIVLIILNLIVLLGQILPEKAPPFARSVNIIFLIFSLLFFISFLRKKD